MQKQFGAGLITLIALGLVAVIGLIGVALMLNKDSDPEPTLSALSVVTEASSPTVEGSPSARPSLTVVALAATSTPKQPTLKPTSPTKVPIVASPSFTPTPQEAYGVPTFVSVPQATTCGIGETVEVGFSFSPDPVNGGPLGMFASLAPLDVAFITNTHNTDSGGTVNISCAAAGETSLTVYVFKIGDVEVSNLASVDYTKAASIAVPVIVQAATCDNPFFFVETGAIYIYANGERSGQTFQVCAGSPPTHSMATFQRFQGGFMILTDKGVITAFFDNGKGEAQNFQNTYQGEALNFPQPPMVGFVAPSNAFGKVWLENPSLAEALGWAYEAAQDYSITQQESSDFSADVWTLPTGGRIFITRTNPPTWNYLNKSN